LTPVRPRLRYSMGALFSAVSPEKPRRRGFSGMSPF